MRQFKRKCHFLLLQTLLCLHFLKREILLHHAASDISSCMQLSEALVDEIGSLCRFTTTLSPLDVAWRAVNVFIATLLMSLQFFFWRTAISPRGLWQIPSICYNQGIAGAIYGVFYSNLATPTPAVSYVLCHPRWENNLGRMGHELITFNQRWVYRNINVSPMSSWTLRQVCD